jgi:hypothetical protein
LMLWPGVTRAGWRERVLAALPRLAPPLALRWLLEAARLAPALGWCAVEAACWAGEPPGCAAAPARLLKLRDAEEPPHPLRRRPQLPIAKAQAIVAVRTRRRANPAAPKVQSVEVVMGPCFHAAMWINAAAANRWACAHGAVTFRMRPRDSGRNSICVPSVPQ